MHNNDIISKGKDTLKQSKRHFTSSAYPTSLYTELEFGIINYGKAFNSVCCTCFVLLLLGILILPFDILEKEPV